MIADSSRCPESARRLPPQRRHRRAAPSPARTTRSWPSRSSSAHVSPASAASRSASSTRSRNRAVVARSASSGSTFTKRARLTTVKRRSPSSAATRAVGLGLGRGPAGALDLGEQLVELLAHLRDRPVEVGPVVADRRRATLRLARVEQRRAATRARRGRSPLRPSCSVLIASQRSRTRPGVRGLRLAEDVRVAADELLVHRPRRRCRGRRLPAPRAAARGSRPGRAGRRARRGASPGSSASAASATS